MKSSPQAILLGPRQIWLDRLQKEGYALDFGSYERVSTGGRVSYFFARPKAWSELIVLFHGTGNDLLFTWQRLIERLLAEGRAVFCFDLDGHGSSSSTVFDSQSFLASASDLRAVLQRVAEDKPYSLIAYSLGGLLALSAVNRGILRPRRLALLALPSSIRLPLSSAFTVFEGLSVFHPEFWRQCRTYGLREAFPAFGPVRRGSFPIRKNKDETRSYPRIVADLFAANPPAAMLAKADVPVLRLYGRWDRLAPPPEASGARIAVIDSSNHFLLPLHRETIERLCQWMNS